MTQDKNTREKIVSDLLYIIIQYEYYITPLLRNDCTIHHCPQFLMSNSYILVIWSWGNKFRSYVTELILDSKYTIVSNYTSPLKNSHKKMCYSSKGTGSTPPILGKQKPN